MKWGDIPTAAKMTAAVVPVLAAAVTWLFVTFETSASSQQKWVQHNQAIACRTVYDLEEKVRQYLERLRFDKSLTDADRRWIDEEIEQLQAKITRLDPTGAC